MLAKCGFGSSAAVSRQKASSWMAEAKRNMMASSWVVCVVYACVAQVLQVLGWVAQALQRVLVWVGRRRRTCEARVH